MFDLRQVAAALGGDVSNSQVLAPGPGHSREDRSLSIKIEPNAPDGFIVHSFASDDPIACRDHVRQRLNLPAFQPNGNRRRKTSAEIENLLAAAIEHERKPAGTLVAKYRYVDRDETLVYEVLKFDNPKRFLQRRPDGNGGWVWKLDERRVLYRLPELLKYPDATVFFTEGEKDADRITELNLCSTTVASGTWRNVDVSSLADRDIIVLQDNDTAGAKRALEAAKQLHGKAKTLRIVLLPDLPDGGDVSDWLDADPRRAEKLPEICFDTPLWEPAVENAQVQEPEPEAEQPKPKAQQPEPPPPLPFINMSMWDNEPVPEQEWAILNKVPLRQVALFTGEGAAGKSTLQLHAHAAGALARDWLHTMPEPGPQLFIDTEDDAGVIHRRLAAIARHYNATFTDLIKGGLHLISLAGQDAVLATVSRSGKIEPTTLYRQLLHAAGDIKPKLIGIASSANVFAGNEADRPQVQQFIGLLTRMAIVANGSVVLISHPSLTGINTDTGLSGSTQWHNAVRARFYMKGVRPESGEQPDGDLREIVFKKNNYGPTSETVVLRYTNGLFLPEPGPGSLEKIAQEQKADDTFLHLLARFEELNMVVSHKPKANNFAPMAFAKESEAQQARITKKMLTDATERLIRNRKIKVTDYGPASRVAQKLIRSVSGRERSKRGEAP